jgi:hypothetical protein
MRWMSAIKSMWNKIELVGIKKNGGKSVTYE